MKINIFFVVTLVVTNLQGCSRKLYIPNATCGGYKSNTNRISDPNVRFVTFYGKPASNAREEISNFENFGKEFIGDSTYGNIAVCAHIGDARLPEPDFLKDGKYLESGFCADSWHNHYWPSAVGKRDLNEKNHAKRVSAAITTNASSEFYAKGIDDLKGSTGSSSGIAIGLKFMDLCTYRCGLEAYSQGVNPLTGQDLGEQSFLSGDDFSKLMADVGSDESKKNQYGGSCLVNGSPDVSQLAQQRMDKIKKAIAECRELAVPHVVDDDSGDGFAPGLGSANNSCLCYGLDDLKSQNFAGADPNVDRAFGQNVDLTNQLETPKDCTNLNAAKIQDGTQCKIDPSSTDILQPSSTVGGLVLNYGGKHANGPNWGAYSALDGTALGKWEEDNGTLTLKPNTAAATADLSQGGSGQGNTQKGGGLLSGLRDKASQFLGNNNLPNPFDTNRSPAGGGGATSGAATGSAGASGSAGSASGSQSAATANEPSANANAKPTTNTNSAPNSYAGGGGYGGGGGGYGSGGMDFSGASGSAGGDSAGEANTPAGTPKLSLLELIHLQHEKRAKILLRGGK